MRASDNQARIPRILPAHHSSRISANPVTKARSTSSTQSLADSAHATHRSSRPPTENARLRRTRAHTDRSLVSRALAIEYPPCDMTHPSSVMLLHSSLDNALAAGRAAQSPFYKPLVTSGFIAHQNCNWTLESLPYEI